MADSVEVQPVWAGLAVRMSDGRLYTVEFDDVIAATLDIHIETIDTTEMGDQWVARKAGDIHIDAKVSGIGHTVSQLAPAMGADRLTKPDDYGEDGPPCCCELVDATLPGQPLRLVRGRADGCPHHETADRRQQRLERERQEAQAQAQAQAQREAQYSEAARKARMAP